jgi:hypothetical protein
MQRVRRKKQEAPIEAPESPTPEAASPEEQPGPGGVRVQWGSFAQNFDLEGMTLLQAYHLVRGLYGIPGGINAYVNGDEAAGDRVLRADDSVEFVRLAGEKGAR